VFIKVDRSGKRIQLTKEIPMMHQVKKFRTAMLIVTVWLGAIVFVACATPQPAATTPPQAAATSAQAATTAPTTQAQATQAPSAGQPRKGGTLNVGLPVDPGTMDTDCKRHFSREHQRSCLQRISL
jgi:hypothetical protein